MAYRNLDEAQICLPNLLQHCAYDDLAFAISLLTGSGVTSKTFKGGSRTKVLFNVQKGWRFVTQAIDPSLIS